MMSNSQLAKKNVRRVGFIGHSVSMKSPGAFDAPGLHHYLREDRLVTAFVRRNGSRTDKKTGIILIAIPTAPMIRRMVTRDRCCFTAVIHCMIMKVTNQTMPPEHSTDLSANYQRPRAVLVTLRDMIKPWHSARTFTTLIAAFHDTIGCASAVRLAPLCGWPALNPARYRTGAA